MAICLEFELVEIVGTSATYKFGPCGHEPDGLVEFDIAKLLNGEIPGDTPVHEAVKVLNAHQSQAMANRVFGKIYRHYAEHGNYPLTGGYYA